MKYDFDFTVIVEFMPWLLEGFARSMYFSVLSFTVALVLGLGILLLRLSKRKVLASVGSAYIEVFRGVPLLVLLIWMYYVLPMVVGVNLPIFVTALLGIGLSMAAYVAEDYRAGVLSVPSGHIQAARGLGMSRSLTFTRIVLPQAIRIALGPLLNSFIITVKGTAILLVLSYPDLMYQGLRAAKLSFRYIEVISFVGLLYFLMIAPMMFLVSRIEGRYVSREVRLDNE